MGNNLNEDLTNRYVVLLPDWFKDKAMAADVRERVVLAKGGFGCSPHTMGNAVFVVFAIDNEETRVEGYDIERFATEEEVAQAEFERVMRAERARA